MLWRVALVRFFETMISRKFPCRCERRPAVAVCRGLSRGHVRWQASMLCAEGAGEVPQAAVADVMRRLPYVECAFLQQRQKDSVRALEAVGIAE